VVIVKVAVVILVHLLRPPEVCPWLSEVQQDISLVLQRAAPLAVELNFYGGTELWFAAYLGAAATEFGAVPLPAPAGTKPQPHGTRHSLGDLTFVALLEENVNLVSDSSYQFHNKVEKEITYSTFRSVETRAVYRVLQQFLDIGQRM
jgi:hypothetical protein